MPKNLRPISIRLWPENGLQICHEFVRSRVLLVNYLQFHFLKYTFRNAFRFQSPENVVRHSLRPDLRNDLLRNAFRPHIIKRALCDSEVTRSKLSFGRHHVLSRLRREEEDEERETR